MLAHERIAEYCRDFKLSGILEHYAALAEEASHTQLSYTDYLCRLVELKAQRRHERGRETILRMAGLPVIKTIDTFDFTDSSVDKR
jgi:DNA replication protein DnaC